MKTLNILGAKYRLKIKQLGPEVWGYCDSEKNEIIISKDALKNKAIYNQTIIHEVIHAALARTGANQTIEPGVQEVVCETIAQVLWDLGVRLK